jgi:putative membrane protein
MTLLAVVFAALAAALHVWIFVMESVRWEDPRTRRTFQMSADEAAATREMAYNQGFYNLFLAVVTVVGLVLIGADQAAAGRALVFAGCGSMLAAAFVLVARSPKRLRAGVAQGATPLLAVVFLVLAL